MDRDIFVENKTSEAILHTLKGSRESLSIFDHSNVQNNSQCRNVVIVIIDSCLALMFAAVYPYFSIFDISIMPRKLNLRYCPSRESRRHLH